MQIGLIGGIGPAATDYYYRRLISEFSRRKSALELTIVHADPNTLLYNLELNDIEAQVTIYNRLTDRLVSAGATSVTVSSIAGHFCIDTFKENSPLHVIDMLEEVDQEVTNRKLGRVGLLGTRTVMESKFYSGISTAEVVTPVDRVLADVHSAYVSMATAGHVTEPQRTVFDSACKWLIQEAAVDAIILGGTDFALVYKENQSQFPIVDCAAIHIDAVVRYAIKQATH